MWKLLNVLRLSAVIATVALIAGVIPGFGASPREIVFTSNQFTPVEEQEWARTTLLRRFTEETGISVRFVTEPEAPFVDRVLAEARAGRGTIDVTGTLHGIFPVFVAENAIRDMAPLQRELDARRDRTFFRDLRDVTRIEPIQAFIPWMQATYLIVARREAMAHFPAGRDPMRMTYDDLLQWGENIHRATGHRRLGFPVGPRGLYGRFLHGFAYPSFTGSQVTTFRSAEAVEMWRYLRRLWGVTHPSSFRWEFMHEPLLTGEAWVAWDHTARLLPALRQRPADFVVLPSPAGPRGRAFLSVVAGLATPRTAPNPELGARLIEYLTRPVTQVTTMEGVGFFPVSPEAARVAPVGGIRALADAVSAQGDAPDARTGLLPFGLGGRTGEFVPIYVDTFRLIVINGRDIASTLEAQARRIEELFRATNAPCPPPDRPLRPCRPD